MAATVDESTPPDMATAIVPVAFGAVTEVVMN